MPAQRAKEVGLVNEVYADQATMLENVLGIAGRIASKSPLAVYGSKQSIVYARDHSVADSLNQIATWQTGCSSPGHDGVVPGPDGEARAGVRRPQPGAARAGLVLGEGDIAHAHERGRNPTAERTEVVVE